MSMRDQQVDMVNTCMKENEVIGAILKKAKRDVIEANVLFSKLRDIPEANLNEESSKIWDLVERVNENVRAFAKELQWDVLQMTTIKNKLKTVTDIERESKKEFWHAVFAFHKSEGQHPKIKRKKSKYVNLPKSTEQINMAKCVETDKNEWKNKWEDTIKREIAQAVDKQILLDCEQNKLTSHNSQSETNSSYSYDSMADYDSLPDKPFPLFDTEEKEPLFETDQEYYTSDDEITTISDLNNMNKQWKRKRLHEFQGDFYPNYKKKRIGTIHLLRGDYSVQFAKQRLEQATASAYMASVDAVEETKNKTSGPPLEVTMDSKEDTLAKYRAHDSPFEDDYDDISVLGEDEDMLQMMMQQRKMRRSHRRLMVQPRLTNHQQKTQKMELLMVT